MNDSDYLQRRNIVKRDPDPEFPDIDPGYKCESRTIPKELYEELVDTLNTPANEQLKADQLDMMEAIADIYTILEGGL